MTTEAHVVEILREEGPKGMHIIMLAERVHMHPEYLRGSASRGLFVIVLALMFEVHAVRIMRLLASHNIFLEMGAGSQWFANNRVSLRLDSKEPLSRVLADPP